MASITDVNNTDSYDNALVGIMGGTDNTRIGNVGDRQKVDAAFSNPGTLPTLPADSLYQDAFGRMRISTPHPIFNSQFIIDKETEKWDEQLTTGGTSTQVTARNCVDMAVTTASGSKVIRQSRRSFFYITGLSKIHFQTFVFNAAKSNLRQRIGAFDDSDGFFLELDGTTVNFVKRSSVTGSPVDTTVAQANWNGDKLNGSGASGKTLNLEKAQILFIDLQYLGVGRVRMGFVIDGLPILAHSFTHANLISNVYATSGKWHLRAEIENTAGTASASTMQHICSSVIIEGNGVMAPGRNFSANNGITTRPMTSGNRTIALAIRPEPSSNITILPEQVSILVTSSNDVLFEFILNASITGGSWSNNSAGCEVNTTITSITGGSIIYSGYIRNGSQVGALQIPVIQETYLGHAIDGTSDTFILAVTPLASNGNCVAAINYKELY